MVVDEVLDDVHAGLLAGGGQPKAAGRVEVDPVGGGQLELAVGERRVGADGGGRPAVGAGEGPAERLVRAVPGLDGDVEHGVDGAGEPVRRPLEQDPAPQRTGRLPAGGGDEPVEVEPGQVRPGGEVVGAQLGVVEPGLCQVEDPGHRVRERHGPTLSRDEARWP